MNTTARLALTLVLFSLASSVATAAEPQPPNILFLFADDLSWEALGSTGGEVATPNLDKLAARGTLFPRAYNMGAWNGAVCVASRTMMITGKSVWPAAKLAAQASSKSKDKSSIDRSECWARWLAGAGYKTYMAGKWHVGLYQPKEVFDVVGTVRPGMPGAVPEGYNRPQSRDDTTWEPWDTKRGGYWQGGQHWSEVLRDEAVDFVRQTAEDDKPFFMYLAFNAPHDPRQAPREFVDRYPVDEIHVPKDFLPEYPYKDAIGCGKGLRDERLAPSPRTPYAIQKNRQEYYALVTHLDEQIGAILDELEATDQRSDTVIFFTGDHGLAAGHHGLMGKQNMYEHSVRTPLIVAGPGLPAGAKRDSRVYIQDIVPTSLELAGTKPPGSHYFKSLLPTLEDSSREPHDTIYGAYLKLQRMAISGDWKIIWYPKAQKLLLFDLAADPLEMHDLSGDPAHAERLAAMQKVLAEEMQRQGDSLSLPQQPG